MAKRHRHSHSQDNNIPTTFSSTKFRSRSHSNSISDPGSDSTSTSPSSTPTSKKYNRIDPKLTPLHKPIITCNFLPTCNQRPFSSYAEFESHYHQQHTNRCHECNKNFPTDRYLMIHIAENHDVFNELKREAGEKTYQCFVEGCERLCSTPRKRRLHVIDKHGFPKDFFFRVVDYGIDYCESLLCPRQQQQQQQRRRRHSTGSPAHAIANTNVKDGSEADIPTASSPLKTRSRGGPDVVDKDENQDNGEDIEQARREIVPSRELDMMDGDGDRNGGGQGEIKFEGDGNGKSQKRMARGRGNLAKQKSGRQSDWRTAADTDKDMTDVTDMMSAVKIAPRQIRFGRGGAAVGFSTWR